VMRAERGIRRADLCILVIDLTMGVTAQDKRIAGLIQKARKPAIIILNKWDLVKPNAGKSSRARNVIERRARDFLPQIRAGVNHVCVDRRKCRSAFC
jgi:Predicted GTPases